MQKATSPQVSSGNEGAPARDVAASSAAMPRRRLMLVVPHARTLLGRAAQLPGPSLGTGFGFARSGGGSRKVSCAVGQRPELLPGAGACSVQRATGNAAVLSDREQGTA